MLRFLMRITLLFLMTVLSFGQAPSAQANLFGDLRGIVTDPIGVRRASATLADSAERTLIQLNNLSTSADNQIKERIEQVRGIMHELLTQALTGTSVVIEQATQSMLALEQRVNADALNLIYRARCALQDTMIEGRRAFALTLHDVIRANPGITIGGIRLTNLVANPVEISDPDQAYQGIRDARMSYLRSRSINDQTKAYEIVSVYANLERMARLTLCSYLDQNVSSIWLREINEMGRLAAPWTVVVALRP
jgi:hypothetical protein